MLTAYFKDGSQSRIEERGECPEFKIGVATRGDGYRRVLFYTLHDGVPGGVDPNDAWVSRIRQLEPVS